MRSKEYTAAIQAAGHLLKLDDDGNVDMFAMSYEYHNGPMCELCYESWCEHCQDPIEPCSAAAIESTCEVVKEDGAPMLLPANVELRGPKAASSPEAPSRTQG